MRPSLFETSDDETTAGRTLVNKARSHPADENDRNPSPGPSLPTEPELVSCLLAASLATGRFISAMVSMRSDLTLDCRKRTG